MDNLTKDIRPVLKLVNCSEFFPRYVPEIKVYAHKMRRKNARNNPTDFTIEEKELIVNGIIQMAIEIKKQFDSEN
jgi:hypothetical protein